ncbi:MAG: hypothetical protein ACOZD0_11080 [Pseudomonadota bacterium]
MDQPNDDDRDTSNQAALNNISRLPTREASAVSKRVSPKTFIYKSARFLGSKHDLGSSLAQALKGAPTLADRRQPLGDPQAPEWLLLNEHRIRKGFVSGVLVRYTPGTAAAAILDDPGAKTAPVGKYTPPKQGGKPTEWLESLLFFTIFKNHLVLMQSSALRASHLEAFLRWFFAARPETQSCGSLELNDRPARVTAKRLRDTPIRNIQIGGVLASGQDTSPKAVASETESRSISVSGDAASAASSDILNALAVLAGKVRGFSGLNLKGLDDSQVSYKLLLTIDRRKTKEDHSQDVLNRLGHALRHAEGVDTRIELADGSSVHGDELRLTGKESLTLYDGLPDTVEVFDRMEHWLLQKVEAGDIEST